MKTFILCICFIVTLANAQNLSRNFVGQTEGTQNNTNIVVDAPAIYKYSSLLKTNSTANFNVTFTGFPNTAAGDSAVNAFKCAVHIWSYILNSNATININAKWDTIKQKNILMQARPDTMIASPFGAINNVDVYYPVALMKAANGGSNPDPYDIIVDCNSTIKNWSFDTTGTPYTNKYDFVTVAMHELAHGFGFYPSFRHDSVSLDEQFGLYGMYGSDICTAYDYYCYSSQQLIQFANDSADIGTALTSNSVYFEGPNTHSMGNAKLYAPARWDTGSSISHLDSVYSHTSNALMLPSRNMAEVIHSPGELGLAVLQDIGWIANRLITITSLPGAGANWKQGSTDTIRWTDNQGGSVAIQLMTASGFILQDTICTTLTSIKGNNNKFVWTIPTTVPTGSYVIVMLNPNSSYGGYGVSSAFTISPANLPPPGTPYITVTNISPTAIPIGQTTVTATVTGNNQYKNPLCPTLTDIGLSWQIDGAAFSHAIHTSGPFSFSVSSLGIGPHTLYLQQVETVGGQCPGTYAVGETTSATLSYPFIVSASAIIDQKLAGSGSTDSVGVWINGNSFAKNLAPDTIPFSPASNPYILLGAQKIVSSQKYNYWSINSTTDPVVTNPQSFQLAASSRYTSQLSPTVDGTSFQVSLEGTSYSDSIRFQDPWFIDINGAYGQQNEGTSAPFKLVTTGGNPLGLTTNYKGVLESQSPLTSPAHYSVQVPSTKTIGGYSSVFLNWTTNANASATQPTSTTSPVVFSNSSATVTANYKGIHLSNNSSTFSDNSQRKVVQTADGWQHMVYEETINGVSHVFYENKPPNGNWQIVKKGNNLWLDGSSGTSPSIDVETYNTSNFYPICIVWQEGGSISYASCVFSSGNYIIYTSGTYATGEPAGSVLSPSVALSIYGYFIVVYKSSISPYGLKYYIGQLGNNNFVPYHGIIANTNSNSSNPTVSATKGSLWFDIAWQQLTLPPPGPPPVAIWTCSMDGNGNSTTPIQLSSSSMKVNSHVSIVSLPDGPRVGWISDKNGTGDPMQTQAVECNGWSPGYYTTYYYSCKSISMSKLDDESNFYFTFSAIFSTPGWNNYDFVVSGKSLSTYRNVSTNLTDIQLCNGPNSSDMFVTAYNNSAAPYYFQTSNSLGSAGLSKTSSAPIVENREVVIENNSAGVCYSLGSITVDGNPVNFIQTAVQSSFDTTKRINAGSMFITVDSVNKVMISEPFNVQANSKINFSEYTGVADSTAITSLFGDKGNVSFGINLVDDATGKILGNVKTTKFSKTTLNPFKSSLYALSAKGLKSGKIRLQVTVLANIDSLKLRIIHHYTDGGETNALSKTTVAQELTFKPVDVITDYALEQNYPNPFNPTTTISYALPNASHVTLKVYDMLGRVVATLVNQNQDQGRYTTTFDASRLASGVYISRLTAGSFTKTMKMLMIK